MPPSTTHQTRSTVHVPRPTTLPGTCIHPPTRCRQAQSATHLADAQPTSRGPTAADWPTRFSYLAACMKPTGKRSRGRKQTIGQGQSLVSPTNVPAPRDWPRSRPGQTRRGKAKGEEEELIFHEENRNPDQDNVVGGMDGWMVGHDDRIIITSP
jgi:hypothetical protein